MGEGGSKCCCNNAADSQEVVEKQRAAGGYPLTPAEEIIGEKGSLPAEVIPSPDVADQVPSAVPMSTVQNRFDNGVAPPAPPRGTVDVAKNEFTIVLQKAPGSKLGVDVDHQDGMTLLVDAVTGGLMEAWNSANPEKQVKVGDRIVEVNGCCGDVWQIVEECKKTQELVMNVRRGSS